MIDRMQCSNPDCYGPTTYEQDALHAEYDEKLLNAGMFDGMAPYITANFTVCIFVCVSVGAGGDSAGVVAPGRGNANPGTWGLGFAGTIDLSSKPPSGNNMSAMGCYGGRMGGFVSRDSPGDGFILGVGTPGVFVGPGIDIKDPLWPPRRFDR